MLSSVVSFLFVFLVVVRYALSRYATLHSAGTAIDGRCAVSVNDGAGGVGGEQGRARLRMNGGGMEGVRVSSEMLYTAWCAQVKGRKGTA